MTSAFNTVCKALSYFPYVVQAFRVGNAAITVADQCNRMMKAKERASPSEIADLVAKMTFVTIGASGLACRAFQDKENVAQILDPLLGMTDAVQTTTGRVREYCHRERNFEGIDDLTFIIDVLLQLSAESALTLEAISRTELPDKLGIEMLKKGLTKEQIELSERARNVGAASSFQYMYKASRILAGGILWAYNQGDNKASSAKEANRPSHSPLEIAIKKLKEKEVISFQNLIESFTEEKLQELCDTFATSIPPEFRDIDIFRDYIDPISNNSIRFPLMLVTSDPSNNNARVSVFYERENVRKWIKNPCNTNKAIPGDPQQVIGRTFGDFTYNHAAENIIRKRCEEVVKDLHERRAALINLVQVNNQS